MTGRRVWPMMLVESNSVKHEPDLGSVVKPLSADMVVPEATYLDQKIGHNVLTQPEPRQTATSDDLLQKLDQFSVTLKGSHCVYLILGIVMLGLAMYLWHLNSRIQGLEALIMAAASAS